MKKKEETPETKPAPTGVGVEPLVMPFNNLSPAEVERLALLLEEIGEAQQVIGKILRHGYENYHPNDPETTNRQLLAVEMGHVMFALQLMQDKHDLHPSIIKGAMWRKEESVKKWLHHQ